MNLPCPAVTSADQEPAAKLLVELETRIATQPLHYRSGDEETAARSVSELFPFVRDLLAKHNQAKAFWWVALRLLNHTTRRFTARWHGWIVEAKFRDEIARRIFRTELSRLQAKLHWYREALGSVADGKSLSDQTLRELLSERAADDVKQSARLGVDLLKAGISDQVAFADGVSAREINDGERKEIRSRRDLLKSDPDHKDTETELFNATGLALSGGGIRSATFCLGIVQVLARRGFLPQFDYLSTVSGGGYLGTFLSCYLGVDLQQLHAAATAKAGEPPPPQPATEEAALKRIENAFGEKNGRESAAMRHLRNSSKYLLNGGLWGRLKIIGLALSGITTNLLMLLPLPLCAALAMWVLNSWDFWGAGLPARAERCSPSTFLLMGLGGIFGILWLFLPLIESITHGKLPGSRGANIRGVWEVVTLCAGLAASAAALLWLMPALLHSYDRARGGLNSLMWAGHVEWDKAGLIVTGLAPLLFGAASIKSLGGSRFGRIAAKLFVLSGPVFFLFVFFFSANRLGLGAKNLTATWNERVFAIIVFALLLWGWWFVNINTLAPHRYYRARLCECYLAVPGSGQRGWLRWQFLRWFFGQSKAKTDESNQVGTLRQLPLSCLGATKAAPYHLINATVNLPTSGEKDLRGRNGDFFLMSRLYCGSPVCGYQPTAQIEKLDPHVDLGTAMAISGAAASVNMGWKTLREFRFLLALLNVRLGYWLRNPRKKEKIQELPDSVGPWYFLRELAGSMHENCHYLNLSDGGHIENLGAYELLRRKCKFIVCVDGGQDSTMECDDLLRLQRYAEIDLGVRLEVQLTDLAPQTNGFSRAYAILVMIDYNPPDNETEAENRKWHEAELGWMLYVKLAVTGTEPQYVLGYRRENPAFPHQSTADQLYDEAQFEAYRRLGECAMESLFREELMGKTAPEKIKDWFQKLANNLLVDNHPCFE